jgi:RNA polymerase sigma-70 factor (ECF subfamily)
MHSDYNEKKLIISCQQGHTDSFGPIYDEHVKTLYNFVYYKVFDKDLAEDLTSQTFFKAIKNIQSVDPERPILSWLYKIAHNSVLDHFKSKHSRPHEDIDDAWDIHDESVNITESLDIKSEASRVLKYLKKLPRVERDIIIMRVWQELPYQAIAEVVGKSEANCKMIYSRSIKKLRSMIPALIVLFMLLFGLQNSSSTVNGQLSNKTLKFIHIHE